MASHIIVNVYPKGLGISEKFNLSFFVSFLDLFGKIFYDNVFFFFFLVVVSSKSYLYEELWKLCVGPLVDLPKFGEKVYYFPQGHIEQIL